MQNPSLERHPLSDAWPDMSQQEFSDLVADVGMNGVITPIVLYGGRILDGWHRYKASNLLDVSCPMEEYSGSDPVAIVIASNSVRRHLSTTQRATAINSCFGWKVGRPVNSGTASTFGVEGGEVVVKPQPAPTVANDEASDEHVPVANDELAVREEAMFAKQDDELVDPFESLPEPDPLLTAELQTEVPVAEENSATLPSYEPEQTTASAQHVADVANVSPRTVVDVRAGVRGGYEDQMKSGEMSAAEAARRTRSTEQGIDPDTAPKTPSHAEVLSRQVQSCEEKLEAANELLEHLNSDPDEQAKQFADQQTLIGTLRSQVADWQVQTEGLKRENYGLRQAMREATPLGKAE